jgi:hypothetical protein
MRHLRIRYTNGTIDIVGKTMLDVLLARDEIAQFYRPSESRWVTVGNDPVRGNGAGYVGPERRVIPEIDAGSWGGTDDEQYPPESLLPSYPHWRVRFREIWHRWNGYDSDQGRPRPPESPKPQ